MIHHSFTPDTPTVSWGAVERYHREVKGWLDVGYHYGVERIADGYYAILGRAEGKDAAACFQDGMNKTAVHICCIGNYDLVAPPQGMIDVMIKRIILPVMSRHGLPVANIIGHRDHAPYKTCPGSQFDLGALQDRVRSALAQ